MRLFHCDVAAPIRSLLLGLALACMASGSWAALPASGIWDTACAVCHTNGPGITAALRTAIPQRGNSTSSVFADLVRTRGSAVSSPPMTNVSNGDAEVVRNYLLQRLFGDIEIAGVTADTAPTYAKGFGTSDVGVEAASAVLTIANGRATAVTYSLGNIGSSSTGVDFWLDGENDCTGRQIPAGGSCSMTLHFRPIASGARPLSFTIVVDSVTHTVNLSGDGRTPTVPLFTPATRTLTPSAVLNTTTGTASTTVTNTGTAPLNLSGVSLGGTYAGEYTFGASNTCSTGASIPAGGSCTLAINFSPTGSTAGTHAASVNFTHNASTSPESIALNGDATVAQVPRISVDVVTMPFDPTQVGTSRSLTANVSNIGNAALSFTSLAVSGTHASDFTRSGSCTTSSAVAAGGGCTIVITFSPTLDTLRTATLSIVSNSSVSPTYSVPLTGTGTPVPTPQANLSATTLPFGNQTVGGVYLARQVTLSNPGTGPLSIASVSVSAGAFSIDPSTTCGSSLAVNASCNLAVRFAPTQAATDYSATLTVASNAAGPSRTVALTGRGTAAAAPVLVWSPAVTAVDFGTVVLGSTSSVRTVTVSNQGPGAATISLINIVGADAAQFTVTPRNCAAAGLLYEGSSCDLDLAFAPGLSGTRSAQVQFASTGSPPPTLTLTGVGSGGAAPLGSLSENAVAFGTVRVGARSTPVEVTLISSGTTPLQVTALSATGPFSVSSRTCPATPFDLPPGSRCVLTVSYAPSGGGTQSGTLSVASNAANGPLQAPLSGQGQAAPEEANSGCSMARGDTPFDPVLWLLALAAAVVLWRRRSAKR